MNKNRMNLRMFQDDVNIIDRTGAESLIPTQEAKEIIQGTIAQSAVLSRGRKLANMTSKQYKMPVLDMLPIAYFTNWMKHTVLGVLSYVAIFVAIFVVVWLSQYLLWKRKIKQMNTLVNKDQ